MGDNTLQIQASSALQGAIQQLQLLAKTLGQTGAAGTQAAGGVNAAGTAAQKSGTQAKQASDSWGGLNSTLVTTASAYAALQVMKESVDLLIQQEQAINIMVGATGNIEKAREEYERWRHVTETLGNEFNRSAIIYARFITTADQAGIPIENARAAADGLAIAQRAMNLSSYDAELAFRALGQIANKTVVNMEELRQQLGERVAGVMDALSKKMGITTKQLFAMTETGEFSAKVFFEKFGPAMAEAFKDQAIVNADSLAANIERIGNAANRMKVEFASGFGTELNQAIKDSGEATKGAEQGFKGLGQAIGTFVGWATKALSYIHNIRGAAAALQQTIAEILSFLVKASAPVADAFGYVASKILSALAAVEKFAGKEEAAKFLDSLAESSKGAGDKLRETAADLDELGVNFGEVAADQFKFQEDMDKSGKAANDAAAEINALADGAKTLDSEFNVLDPAISKFIDKMNALKEQTTILVTAYERLTEAQGGALNPDQMAAFRNEVEKLVRAYDFKDIPPQLLEVAKALGVSTTSTKEATAAARAFKNEQKELLQEINKVTDALQKQAQTSAEAAKKNADEIKELEEKFLTGLDPEELNRLNELKDAQFGLNQKAKEDAQVAEEAVLFLADANERAGNTSEVAAGQYDMSKRSLVGVEEAALNARDRLYELQAAYAASGGAAGQFGVPGGSPGAPSGPGVGPFTPGVAGPGGMAPPGQSYGPNGNEYSIQGGLYSNVGPYGQPGQPSSAPIDLFNALDTGLAGTDPDTIAKMLVEQWLGVEEAAASQAASQGAPKGWDAGGGEGTVPGGKESFQFGQQPGDEDNLKNFYNRLGEVNAQAEQMGDTWLATDEKGQKFITNFEEGLGVVEDKIQTTTTAVKGMTTEQVRAAEAAGRFSEEILKVGDRTFVIEDGFQNVDDVIRETDGSLYGMTDTMENLGVTSEATAGSIASGSEAARDLSREIQDAGSASDNLGESAKRAGDAQVEALDSVIAKLEIAKGLWVDITNLQREAAADL